MIYGVLFLMMAFPICIALGLFHLYRNDAKKEAAELLASQNTTPKNS